MRLDFDTGNQRVWIANLRPLSGRTDAVDRATVVAENGNKLRKPPLVRNMNRDNLTLNPFNLLIGREHLLYNCNVSVTPHP